MTEYQSNKTLVVGIDPDVDKSGIAIWDAAIKKLTVVEALAFWDIIPFILSHSEYIKKVRIEAGWLNSSNWHTHTGKGEKRRKLKSNEMAESGRRVGRNHQVGILLMDFCKKYAIDCEEVKPYESNWWKNDGNRFALTTGWKGVTNPEKRDAAMLVYGIK